MLSMIARDLIEQIQQQSARDQEDRLARLLEANSGVDLPGAEPLSAEREAESSRRVA